MEREFVLGAIFSEPDVRDYKIACVIDESQFPKEFRLNMPIIKDQKSVGSCVAHAVSEVIEYHHTSETQQIQQFSTGYIYGNRTFYTGSGMAVREALKNVNHFGDVKNELFDVNIEVPEAIARYLSRPDSLDEMALPYRFSAYYKCNGDLEIKKSLMEHGPVVFAMEWFSDIEVDPLTGIINTKAEHNPKNGGHCMVIYGWTESGWMIQNSWGKSWGLNGCAILPYETPIKEAWGIADEIKEGDIIRPYTSFFGRIFAKVQNFILRTVQNIKKLFKK